MHIAMLVTATNQVITKALRFFSGSEILKKYCMMPLYCRQTIIVLNLYHLILGREIVEHK